MHIILLGDSIFDNKVYVQPHEPDVREQLQALLPDGDRATLLAVDGSVIRTVTGMQTGKIPDDATNLVISAGGNDLLGKMGILEMPASNIGEALFALSGVGQNFQTEYASMLAEVLNRKLPTVLCTIYNPNFEGEIEQTVATTAVSFFNDIIIRQGIKYGLPVIDLRLMFDSPADYANPIEPSAKGGQKIAEVIKRVVETHPFDKQTTSLYV